MGIAPIDRSRLVGHPDITDFMKRISRSEKNWLTATKKSNIRTILSQSETSNCQSHIVKTIRSVKMIKHEFPKSYYENHTERQHDKYVHNVAKIIN